MGRGGWFGWDGFEREWVMGVKEGGDWDAPLPWFTPVEAALFFPVRCVRYLKKVAVTK